MPFPTPVWKESGLLYFNNENITGLDFATITWTGEVPILAVTNRYTDAEIPWEEITLGASGDEIAHTFSTVGQNLAWKVVFIKDETQITGIRLKGDSSMTGSGVITTDGMKIVLDRTFSSSPTRTFPNQFMVGEGTTDATVSDTALVKPRAIENYEVVDTMDATTGWTASGTNSVTLNTTTYVRATGALNLIKSDTGSAIASMSKTTTSLNFTSKTFFAFVYISSSLYANLAASAAVVFRFGSDSSNYYQFAINKVDLTTLWNHLQFSTATATSTVGSPSLSAMDYTYFALEATGAGITCAAGDFIVDEPFLWDSTDLDKTQETGYPAISYADLSVELRGRLNTLNANGFLLTEVAFSNLDSTPLLFSRDTFSALSKTDVDEFIFSQLVAAKQGGFDA